MGIGMLVESEAYLPARECAISRLETQCNNRQDPSPPNQMMRTSCKENPDSSIDQSHREGRIPVVGISSKKKIPDVFKGRHD